MHKLYAGSGSPRELETDVASQSGDDAVTYRHGRDLSLVAIATYAGFIATSSSSLYGGFVVDSWWIRGGFSA